MKITLELTPEQAEILQDTLEWEAKGYFPGVPAGDVLRAVVEQIKQQMPPDED